LLAFSDLYTRRNEFWMDLFQLTKPVEKQTIDAVIDDDKVPTDFNGTRAHLITGFWFTKGRNKKLVTNNDWVQMGKSQANTHTNMIKDTSMLSQNIDLICKTIDLALRKKIRVIMLSTPTTNYYKDSFDKEIISDFYKRMNLLLKKYKKKEVYYFDFSGSKEFTMEMFYDSNHLNYLGAKLLTRLLDKRILSLE
jgi:hypothetical protein